VATSGPFDVSAYKSVRVYANLYSNFGNPLGEVGVGAFEGSLGFNLLKVDGESLAAVFDTPGKMIRVFGEITNFAQGDIVHMDVAIYARRN
jgi:hypothetical protein